MSELRYRFDQADAPDFSALLDCFKGKALRSPFRSTVPLLSLVEHSRPEWRSLLQKLGAPTEAVIHFEYRVTSLKLGGTPSQTDALLLSEKDVWAVEAKWTEPRYQTVAKRMSRRRADGSDSRAMVRGWLDYLCPFAGGSLRIDDFAALPYQLLHRAASACAVGTDKGLRPRLVYLHFQLPAERRSPTVAHYVADLKGLHSRLGSPTGLTCAVVELPLRPTPAFESIRGLDKQAAASAARVVDALRTGPLFTFGQPGIHRI